jgi:hypothetical protein
MLEHLFFEICFATLSVAALCGFCYIWLEFKKTYKITIEIKNIQKVRKK